MAEDFGRCLERIVPAPYEHTVQCDGKRFHQGPHRGHDSTHEYAWHIIANPIGWQSDIATRRSKIVPPQNESGKTP